MQLARQGQRIEDDGVLFDARRRGQARQLGVEESDVERRVVDDQLGIAYELDEVVGQIGKTRLVGQKLVGNAVNGHGAVFNVSIGVDVDVKAAPGLTPLDHLQGTDLDNAVPLLGFEAGGFGIKNDLSHVDSLSSS